MGISPEVPGILSDFSGGLNTLFSPNRLDPKFTPSAVNVWYDDQGLSKRPGQSQTSTGTILGRSWSGYSMHDSIFSGSEELLLYGSAGVGMNFLIYSTDAININLLSTGGTGTATFSSLSPTVTGSGTNWQTGGPYGTGTAAVGALFTSGNTVGVILTVNSDTSLTLTGNFGATGSGSAYVITNSWSSSNRVSYADMNQKCWITGWGSTPVSWDGSTLGFVTAFPQAAYSLNFSNYMFAANTTANPSRVYWSSLQDPTTWPAINFVDVNPNDGFPIVGLFFDGQSLCILKSNSMWKLSGTVFDPNSPTYTLTQVYTPTDFFVNSPKTVQLYQDSGFIILGKKGFYIYNGAGAVAKMMNFDIIRSTFSTNAAFNWGNVPAVTAEPTSLLIDGSIWFQVPYTLSTISSSHKELTYVIDKNGSVWQWRSTSDGTNTNGNGIISDLCYFQGSVYGVNSYSGGTPGIIQVDTGNSDAQSSAISAQFTTKLIEFQNQNRFGLAYVYYKIQTPVTPTGTVTTASASTSVTGVSTNFLSILVAGATITVGGVTGTVLTVNSNTSLTLTAVFGANNSGVSYTVSGGTAFNFSYSINSGSYISTSIDMTTGASGFGVLGKSVTVLVGQVGRTIQFQVSNSSVGQMFEIYGIEFDHQELRQ